MLQKVVANNQRAFVAHGHRAVADGGGDCRDGLCADAFGLRLVGKRSAKPAYINNFSRPFARPLFERQLFAILDHRPLRVGWVCYGEDDTFIYV